MKNRVLVAALMVAALALPAPAFGTDQDVDVQVHPADTLGIGVQEFLNFQMAVGATNVTRFHMEVLNTTAGGWEVTVAGPDLQSYYWLDCDEFGQCSNRAPTDPPYTIDNANLTVTGGDACYGCEDPGTDPMITAHSVPLNDAPTLLMEGTAEAWGLMGFGDPYDARLQLTVPEGTAAGYSYWTTITYTIMAP